jgi:hypothetical protein
LLKAIVILIVTPHHCRVYLDLYVDRYGVDTDIMNATLHETLEVWDWGGAWG